MIRPMTPGDEAAAIPADDDGGGESVLAKLPRARPQRSSPRRSAGQTATRKTRKATSPTNPRSGSARTATAKARSAKTARSSASAGPGRSAKARSTRGRNATTSEKVPKQGYAADGERATGPVQPPGGVELLATAGEIVNELARAGVSTGERVIRDLLDRLPF
jgi:hypothetical protein